MRALSVIAPQKFPPRKFNNPHVPPPPPKKKNQNKQQLRKAAQRGIFLLVNTIVIFAQFAKQV
jgi:hypothetical protein